MDRAELIEVIAEAVTKAGDNPWKPITNWHRDDGVEIVVRLRNSHPRMPAKLLGRSVHQIGTWIEGDLWVVGCKLEDALVEGVMPLMNKPCLRAKEQAEAALRAIEEAGFVLVRKDAQA